MALARFIGDLFSRSGRWSFPWSSRSRAPHLALGRRGEDLAAVFLRRNGYRVLYRNFRGKRGGEIDLVCRDVAEKTLVFVEVKTRHRSEFGRPADAVGREKQALLARGAIAWLRLLGDDNHEIPFRFDIVEIVFEGKGYEIEVIQNAFQMPERYYL